VEAGQEALQFSQREAKRLQLALDRAIRSEHDAQCALRAIEDQRDQAPNDASSEPTIVASEESDEQNPLQEVQEKLQDSQIELMEKRMEVYGLRQELLRSQEAMDALKEKVHAALLLSLSALLQ